MDWISLEDELQLKDIIERSEQRPQLIFKHSTRCSVSSMAKNRLMKNELPEEVDFYYLDLLKHRNISNKIAADFDVEHQSPQVLLIKNGKCVYTESHSAITMDEIEEMAAA